MWAITKIGGTAQAMIGVSETRRKLVSGDVIILHSRVKGEADLQMLHMWITANYWIIQRPECWLPNCPHANSKKQGDPGERPDGGQ